MRTRRDREGRPSGAPYLFPAGLALLAAVAAWLSWGRLVSCGRSLERPETQIRRALSGQERAHLDDVYGFHAGGTVELYRTRYEDVVPDVAGDRAVVVAMLSAEGRVAWRDQAAELAYLGRERFHMKPCAIAGWCAEGDQFARLRGVLAVLFRRLDAAAQRAPGDRVRVTAWQIRVDRDRAEVGEDAEVQAGDAPPRRERRVYQLARQNDRWVLAGGM